VKGLPKAKEMLELQWDENLEREAQRFVIKKLFLYSLNFFHQCNCS
jgi:hypothetical protein